MKIGIVMPTTMQQLEKQGALWRKHDLYLLGPCARYYRDHRIQEWKELGINFIPVDLPYSQIDHEKYDLIFESYETSAWDLEDNIKPENSWLSYRSKWNKVPRILKVLWTDGPLAGKDLNWSIDREYLRNFKYVPVVLEMPKQRNWERMFSHVFFIPNYPGDWWFDTQWTGEREEALWVLSGLNAWRFLDTCGYETFKKLSEIFPGKIVHQDCYVHNLSIKDFVTLKKKSRVYLTLGSDRPLTISFTESLSLGMPILATDHPGTAFKQYIQDWKSGLATSDLEEMRKFLEKCFNDMEFVARLGSESRKIGERVYSRKTLEPVWDEALETAFTDFNNPIRRTGKKTREEQRALDRGGIKVIEEDFAMEEVEKLPLEARILDVGCGESLFLEEVRKKGYLNSIAMDPMEPENYKGKPYFLREDIRNTSLMENSFDLISCLGTLEHIGTAAGIDPRGPLEDQKAIEAMRKILKPNGVLVLCTHLGKEHKDLEWKHRNYTYEDIKKFCEGFEVLREETFGLLDGEWNGPGWVAMNYEAILNIPYSRKIDYKEWHGDICLVLRKK